MVLKTLATQNQVQNRRLAAVDPKSLDTQRVGPLSTGIWKEIRVRLIPEAPARMRESCNVPEQEMLHDYETGRTKKAKQDYTTPRLKAFRCKLQNNELASSLNEEDRQWLQTRHEALQKARDALRLGASLARQRDDKKRSYTDMDNAEQKVLEDYKSGRTKTAKQGLTIPKMKPFRCKLQDFGNPD